MPSTHLGFVIDRSAGNFLKSEAPCLSSAESSFVTGIVLAVDGGRSYH